MNKKGKVDLSFPQSMRDAGLCTQTKMQVYTGILNHRQINLGLGNNQSLPVDKKEHCV